MLRNALVPIVTVLGLTLALMIGGAVVTETGVQPARCRQPGGARPWCARDYPVIQGTLLVIAGILDADQPRLSQA